MTYTWEVLRIVRDQKLKESDFTQLDDVKYSMDQQDQDLWTQYRQILRDTPDQVSDPQDVVWPVRPDEM